MKLFIMLYTGSLQGQSGISVFDNYSLEDACPTCGTMAQLNGNLHVKKANYKKLLFQTLDYDTLIESTLYNSLKLEGIKIGRLQPVVEKKSKLTLSYYHLTTNIYLPRMNPDSSGFLLEDQCKTCKRDGYFDDLDTSKQDPNVPNFYKYNYSDIEKIINLSDICYTWEHFGTSGINPAPGYIKWIAKPRFIVTENFKNALKKVGVKSLFFEEIILIK